MLKSSVLLLLLLISTFSAACRGGQGLPFLQGSRTPSVPSALSRVAIVIDKNFILNQDMNFTGNGMVISADNITIDLGGHTIRGPGKGPWIWPEPALSSVGIEVKGRSNVVVKNGRIENFATAIFLADSGKITIENITTQLNHYGIYMYETRESTISQNQITSNIYGLTTLGADNNLIIKNHVFRNHHFSPGGYGINLIASFQNVIKENLVEDNMTQGIWLIKAGRNTIYHNNVSGNNPNGEDQGGANNWYEPKLKQGNYWGDYEGRDLNGDGIGDAPYQLFSEPVVEDPYPIMKPKEWLQSNLLTSRFVVPESKLLYNSL
jgi:parallel beta-helix repeat protein